MLMVTVFYPSPITFHDSEDDAIMSRQWWAYPLTGLPWRRSSGRKGVACVVCSPRFGHPAILALESYIKLFTQICFCWPLSPRNNRPRHHLYVIVRKR